MKVYAPINIFLLLSVSVFAIYRQEDGYSAEKFCKDYVWIINISVCAVIVGVFIVFVSLVSKTILNIKKNLSLVEKVNFKHNQQPVIFRLWVIIACYTLFTAYGFFYEILVMNSDDNSCYNLVDNEVGNAIIWFLNRFF